VHTVDSVHKIIFDLRPAVLDDLGLTSALRWYAQNRLKERGVSVRVEVTGEERKLPATIENAIFRVVQEAVNNISRHAEAQNALLSVEFSEKALSIEIEDDGRGFNVGDFELRNNKVQGLGLAGMAERVSLIGGNLRIDSQPGAGTHILITIPL
jgi:signal transduction histidine kinase